jgi:hypothetical protein
MIESVLFEEPNTRSRFLAAPCLKEREQYLYHLMRRGYGPGYLRVTSGLLLRTVQILGLTKLRMVELEEIERSSPSLGCLSRAGFEEELWGERRCASLVWRRTGFNSITSWRYPLLTYTRMKWKSQTSVSSCVGPTEPRPGPFMDRARERSYSFPGLSLRAESFRVSL